MRHTTKFPSWLRKQLPKGSTHQTRGILDGHGLHTVCTEAKCPNQCECYTRGTATFLIMGNVCTRACRFCNVTDGTPQALDATEPQRLVDAVQQLKLKHVVITSVTRDDLADGGAGHFRAVLDALHAACPQVTTEVLVPDFQGSEPSLRCVMDGKPTVFNHNVETISRLYATVRPQAQYERSLAVVRRCKELYPAAFVKSGFMVGLGETRDEACDLIRVLAVNGCDCITIGQYLQPSHENVEVARFVEPAEFEHYQRIAEDAGIRYAFAGPFVRSSYLAEQVLARLRT